MNDNRHRDDVADPLTRLLRDADPAAADPGLDPVERARLRQAIIAAAGDLGADHRPASWFAWAAPALAAAAAVAIIGLAVWMLGGATVAPPADAIVDAGAVGPAGDRGNPTPQDPADSSSPPAPDAAPSGAAPAPAVAAVHDPSPADKQARELRFTAPGGTRIIWTLDPEFESPITGSETR